MFRYKAIGQNSTSAWALRSGKLMDKTAYEKRVIAKSGPPHVENFGSGKSQHPLIKSMLPFSTTACISQGVCNSIRYNDHFSGFDATVVSKSHARRLSVYQR